MPTPEKPKPEDSFWMDMQTSTNLLYIISNVHSLCLIPFIRTSTGTRYLGLHGFLALIMQWMYGGLSNAPEMIAYSFLWLSFAVYRRMTAAVEEFTDFQGKPFLTQWLFRDYMTALLAEALLMLPIGAGLARVSQPLGNFVMLGVVSLGVKYCFWMAIESREIDVLHDGVEKMKYKQGQVHRARRGR